MRNWISVSFLFIIISYPVFPHETRKGISPDSPLNDLSMDQWTGQDGLVSNNLTSVNQSSDNFLWITTFNGILRFDGVNFKIYDKNNLPFLNSNAFYRTYEDSNGNLWFTSQSSGIIKLANNSFSQIQANDQGSLSVRCIEEDKDGNIWVGTNNQGVYSLRDSILIKVEYEEFERSNIMDIKADHEGNIWFATNGNGVLVFDGRKVRKITVDHGLNHNTVNKLLLSEEGQMYIGSLNGINLVTNGNIDNLELLEGLEINDMLIDDYKSLWVGSEQGLYKLYLPTNELDSFTEQDGLPASQISSLCFDHENSLWISTKKAGLIRFRDGFFDNITHKDHLSSENVNIVVEHENQFYIGCDDGLINIYKDNEIELFRMKSSYYNVGIRDINFGENGDILVASYRGLLSIKDGVEELIDLSSFGLSNDLRRILRASDGTIWLATRSSGVVKLIEFNRAQSYNSSNGLKADYILAIEENKDGEIYVGTHSGGLSIIRKNGEVDTYPIEEGKSGILIFNLEILDDNTAWLATNIGVYKFENDRFLKIQLDESLNAETIFDIVLENNNAWLSTNKGLINVAVNNLNSFVKNDIEKVPGRLFDRYDGMASHECTGATRMTLSSDGKLWIPTLGGVAVINPKNVAKNISVPKVYVTEFFADFKERKLNADSKIEIEPGVMRYEINFTSLSYIAPPKVRFQYKLEGLDSDWSDVGTTRKAIYTNLPKGKYTFKVIASNNDGIWNDTGAALQFEIKPYFYETILFFILAALAIGFSVWGIIVWRIRNIARVNAKLIKLNEELDRFVYSASHDLRAPLSSVMGLVRVARLEPSMKAKDECLSMINESVQKLDGFINDIIDYSRNQRIEIQVEEVDLEKEINDIFNELKFYDKKGSIEKILKCSDKRTFLTDGRRVSIIMKNLISNAIRYHDFEKEKQFIQVELSYNSKSAIIKVTDNGIGIEEEHLNSIFKMFYRADEGSKGSGLGLYIVKETVDKLKGEITVHSKINEGTTFTITLPPLKPTE